MCVNTAFAIMRNSHEAIRSHIKEMMVLIDGDNASQFDAFNTSWSDLHRIVQVHMSMEDHDMFPLLIKANGGPINLEHLHEADAENEKYVNDCIAKMQGTSSSDDKAMAWAELGDALKNWREAHLAHLKKEEEVMMPLTMKTGATPVERTRVVHTNLVTTALARNASEFEYYIGWCVRKLSKHGSPMQSPEVATRVFVRGLWCACSTAQWAIFRPVVQKNCTAEQWSALVDAYNIDVPVGDESLSLSAPAAAAAAAAATPAAASAAASATSASSATKQSTAAESNTAESGSGGGCCIIS